VTKLRESLSPELRSLILYCNPRLHSNTGVKSSCFEFDAGQRGWVVKHCPKLDRSKTKRSWTIKEGKLKRKIETRKQQLQFVSS